MPGMRIVLTTNASPWSPADCGGAGQVHHLATALVRRGHEVTVLATKPRVAAVEPTSDPDYQLEWVAGLARGERAESRLRPLNAVPMAAAVARVLSRGGVQAVHGVGEEAALLAAVQQRYRFTSVVTPRVAELPLALTYADALEPWDWARLGTRGGRWVVLREICRRTHWVCPTSTYVADQLRRAFALKDRQIRVVRDGVEPTLQAARWQAPSGAEAPVVFFGRFDGESGVDRLIEAFGRLPPPRPPLCLVGEGPQLLPARQRAAELGLRMEIDPPLCPEDLVARLRSAAMVVFPARAEPVGAAVADAMAMGLPVVATAVGSAPERITDGLDGLLVPPSDLQALAHAIARLLAEPGLAARLGAAAREGTGVGASWDAVAARYEDCYRGAPR